MTRSVTYHIYTTYSSNHQFSKGHSCNNTSVQCCIHGGSASSCSPTQSIAAFEAGSFLPLPSWEAVEKSIGKGGNGTISIVYFKGAEFAVKRVSNTRWFISYRVACDIRTGDLWHVTLVRMWNTYVMQLVTHVQYVCVECATPDRPTPPMHADHTSIHTYTCTYHSPHTPRLAVAIYKTCKQFVQSALESAVSALLTCQACPSTSGWGAGTVCPWEVQLLHSIARLRQAEYMLVVEGCALYTYW